MKQIINLCDFTSNTCFTHKHGTCILRHKHNGVCLFATLKLQTKMRQYAR